ncbi:sulfur carrier protein ThiS [Endozoicomonas sp. SCSIO W0465]|uniref:sulfur carrier protein ThiS n=1 Tax=Endozoicomonas sp. SCSIO W0465 TaxID=2918516 RepID=UPI00207518B4|nr:sulfur carrier protein ThiS [Endozoicomonas sp. SCSIO W0465]USE37393.1 sulfur carrier protein ThiS [Endozoicomonas sp. SCSIO W0465]
MKLFINGAEQSVARKMNLLSLLQQIETQEHFAVAVNQSFVPRSGYESYELKDGDKVEIVSPIQGG